MSPPSGAPLRIALVVTLVACSDVPAPDEAGVDEIPLLTVREDLRIGSVDDPDAGFTYIADVAVGPDGLIYALDGRDQVIRVFDQAGAAVRSMGRLGEGPGEFLGATLMGFRADTLWVNDRRQQRVTLMSPRGEYLSTFPVGMSDVDATEGVFARLYAAELRDDGRLDSQAMFGFMSGADIPDSVAALPEVVFDRRGRVVDTVGYAPWVMGGMRTVDVGGQDAFVPSASPDVPIRVRFRDGSVVVVQRPVATSESGATFGVTRLDPRGDTIYERRIPYHPRGFNAVYVDTLIWRYGRRLVENTDLDSATVEGAFRDALDLPEFQTPVSLALPGEDGSLWLRREDDGGPVFRWLVLDIGGSPVGRVELPRRANIQWATIDVVYAAETDDLGIPWLVRYRIGGQPASVADVPFLEAQVGLRIGSLEDPEEGFARIADVAPGPDGLIYVLEAQDQQIRVYDGSGALVRTLGRLGEGPGEFVGATTVGFRGDTLWVNDPRQQRVTIMGLDGEPVATFPAGAVRIDVAPGLVVRVYADALREDGLLDSRHEIAVVGGPGRASADRPPSSLTVPILLFDREGNVVDTVAFEETVVPDPGPRVRVGGQDLYAPQAPSDGPLRVRFLDGAAEVDRSRVAPRSEGVFTVTRVGGTGDTLYRRRLGYLPRGFAPAFVDTLIWRYGRWQLASTDLDSARVEAALREALELPPHQTPISLAVAGEDGSLWLRREDDGGRVFRWLVLDVGGSPVGRVELPRRATIQWATMDVIYAAVTDDLGIPWLVRYRIGG